MINTYPAKTPIADSAILGSTGLRRTMIANAVKIDGEGLAERLVKDVHTDLEAALRGADLWDSLDYFEISMAMQKRANGLFPSFEWLACAPVTSAGHHYVYVGTVFKGRYNLIFVGKTSRGFRAACEIANICAHELRA
jgi:hypothetical protein